MKLPNIVSNPQWANALRASGMRNDNIDQMYNTAVLNLKLKLKLIQLMAQKQSKNLFLNKRNPIAKALKFFTPKVIRDKTKYKRKDKHVQKRSFWESS